MNFSTRDLPGGFGVEVEGLDLSEPLSDETQQALRQLWLEQGLLLFRGLGDSAETQLNLSRSFGELAIHPLQNIRVEGYPELIWFSNKEKRQGPVYYYDDKPTLSRLPWHTDLVYTPNIGTGGLLRMLEVPQQAGGTMWADTAAAYDALSASMKRRIDGLEGLFRFVLDPCDLRFGRHPNIRPETEGENAMGDIEFPDLPDVIHPLVLTHPETGRRSLNVSPLNLRYIVGMPLEEGDALVQELVAQATSPQFTYLHHWQPNDMIVWDNRRTMHSTEGHPPDQIRTVHRTTIKGPGPVGRLADTVA